MMVGAWLKFYVTDSIEVFVRSLTIARYAIYPRSTYVLRRKPSFTACVCWSSDLVLRLKEILYFTRESLWLSAPDSSKSCERVFMKFDTVIILAARMFNGELSVV